MAPPCSPPFFVGSVNGLICLFNRRRDTYIWNPTIRKSKKLLKSSWGSSCYTKYGFGYDDSRDDYKVLFIDHCGNSYNGELSNTRVVVNIYSSRTDSWTTLYDQLQGIFLLNYTGKFINGKIYWAASTGIHDYNVRNIISFDVADETWGSLELPICGEEVFNIKLGVVENDLSVLYTCYPGTTSDVWILKDSRVNVSWMKWLTIEYPQYAVLYRFDSPIFTFSIHFRESDKGNILLFIPEKIMIFDDSTKKLEHEATVKECNTAEIYAESIVNPLTIPYDYKALFIDHCGNSYNCEFSNMRVVVNIYSSRTDSWTTLHEQLQGIFLLNYSGKFINGKIYWDASLGIHDYNQTRHREAWSFPFVEKKFLISNWELWKVNFLCSILVSQGSPRLRGKLLKGMPADETQFFYTLTMLL
ncbi:hypothetical protein H5410_065008 [Solanum commersonii]|uniref:F-box associated beta-propeller type 1 domain-containing protein n=1 Tax=Solanum commersonii TaxID=4109 RepID=A0A9J5VXR3_SOLCO|nr:hypothetical protein H5410_065008 [Solanum commersonii]